MDTIPENVAICTDIYALAIAHGASRELCDKIMKRFNSYIGDRLPHLLSSYCTKKILRDIYPVKPKSYPVCQNGCMLLSNPSPNVAECPYCMCTFFYPNHKPKQTVEYLSLSDQLALMVKDDGTRDLLKYGQQYSASDDGVMYDMFDSPLMKKIKKTHLFDGDINLSLILFTDDFQPFKRSSHSMMLVHGIVLDLSPEVRYEQKNMLQICTTPGPRTIDVSSFLEPVLQDLKAMAKDGFLVQIGNAKLRVKAHLMLVGGDMPAVAKMTGLVGHTGYYGCRFCYINGTTSVMRDYHILTLHIGEHNGSTVTFPPEDVASDIRLPDMYKSLHPSVGQRYASPFSMLPSFHGYTFFPMDIMHLLGHGIAHQVWNIMRGSYDKNSNPLYLSTVNRSIIGKQFIISKQTTPSSFSGSCGDIEQKAGFFRAVDWIHFARFFLPTIVLEYVSNPVARRALYHLSNIYAIAFSRRIIQKDVKLLKISVAG